LTFLIQAGLPLARLTSPRHKLPWSFFANQNFSANDTLTNHHRHVIDGSAGGKGNNIGRLSIFLLKGFSN